MGFEQALCFYYVQIILSPNENDDYLDSWLPNLMYLVSYLFAEDKINNMRNLLNSVIQFRKYSRKFLLNPIHCITNYNDHQYRN